MNKIFVLGVVLAFIQTTQAFELTKLSRFEESVFENDIEVLKNNELENLTAEQTAQVIPDECQNKNKNEDSVVINGELILCKKIRIKTLSLKEFKEVQAQKTQSNLERVTENKIDDLLKSIFMDIDKFIAVGEKIIKFVEAGKPVVTNKPLSASVLPKTNDRDFAFSEMSNWSVPKTALFKVSYRNGYGSEVVTFNYAVTFQYNGTYNGKGKYLHGIRVAARNINVSWGFDLNANSELLSISNVGSKESPIAGATVEITYTVQNWLKSMTTAESFFVDGRGNIYKLD